MNDMQSIKKYSLYLINYAGYEKSRLWIWKIFLIAGLLLFSLPVFSSEAVQQLDKFFSEVNSFQGQFLQTVFNENDEVIQDAKGNIALDKPGRFRWQYTQPYPQLILADGEYLWIYDEELLQAIAKPIDVALGNAPIMLLTDIRPLAEDFEIMEAPTRDGLNWVELVPLIQDTEFHRIQIGLDAKGIQKMVLHDHFSQKTVIEFINLEMNVKFPNEYFTFTAPEGVDVVGYPTVSQ